MKLPYFFILFLFFLILFSSGCINDQRVVQQSTDAYLRDQEIVGITIPTKPMNIDLSKLEMSKSRYVCGVYVYEEKTKFEDVLDIPEAALHIVYYVFKGNKIGILKFNTISFNLEEINQNYPDIISFLTNAKKVSYLFPRFAISAISPSDLFALRKYNPNLNGVSLFIPGNFLTYSWVGNLNLLVQTYTRKHIIPVVILSAYENDEPIVPKLSDLNIKLLRKTLEVSGPVIVFTQSNLNPNQIIEHNKLSNVIANQICLLSKDDDLIGIHSQIMPGISVRMDYSEKDLETIFKGVQLYNSETKECQVPVNDESLYFFRKGVLAIGFGIDTRYTKAKTPEDLVIEVNEFIKNITIAEENVWHDKLDYALPPMPIYIYYTYFDDSWSDEDIAKFYYEFMASAIPLLNKKGVVFFAAQPYYEGTYKQIPLFKGSRVLRNSDHGGLLKSGAVFIALSKRLNYYAAYNYPIFFTYNTKIDTCKSINPLVSSNFMDIRGYSIDDLAAESTLIGSAGTYAFVYPYTSLPKSKINKIIHNFASLLSSADICNEGTTVTTCCDLTDTIEEKYAIRFHVDPYLLKSIQGTNIGNNQYTSMCSVINNYCNAYKAKKGATMSFQSKTCMNNDNGCRFGYFFTPIPDETVIACGDTLNLLDMDNNACISAWFFGQDRLKIMHDLISSLNGEIKPIYNILTADKDIIHIDSDDSIYNLDSILIEMYIQIGYYVDEDTTNNLMRHWLNIPLYVQSNDGRNIEKPTFLDYALNVVNNDPYMNSPYIYNRNDKQNIKVINKIFLNYLKLMDKCADYRKEKFGDELVDLE